MRGWDLHRVGEASCIGHHWHTHGHSHGHRHHRHGHHSGHAHPRHSKSHRRHSHHILFEISVTRDHAVHAHHFFLHFEILLSDLFRLVIKDEFFVVVVIFRNQSFYFRIQLSVQQGIRSFFLGFKIDKSTFLGLIQVLGLGLLNHC